MANTVVSMNNISFSYENKLVLDRISFEIPKGAFMGLVGPNGGGKTTLIKLLLGILKPEKGNIELLHEPIRKFSEWRKIGFVSQKANTFNRGFPATVYEVVSTGLTAKIGYFKFFKKEHKAKIIRAINQVGLLEYANDNIGDLSGGQQQRVFIARSLVNDPELLILDEPTVGVDYENVNRFYELLHQLNKEKQITLLIVTHDTDTMTEYATSIMYLNKTMHFQENPKKYTSSSKPEMSQFYGHPVKLVTHDH